MEDLNKPEEYLPFVVATLNSYSKGTLYFGVTKKGDCVGISHKQPSFSTIFKAFEEEISPKVFPLITTLEGNRNVIKVEFEGNHKPYTHKGKYYLKDYQDIRTLDYSSLMKEIRFIDKCIFYEEETTSFSYRKLDDSLVKETFNNAISNKLYRPKSSSFTLRSTLENWGLSNRGYVNRAAYLLFGKNAQISLTINVYKDDKRTQIASSNLYKGNILSLIKLANETTKKVYLSTMKVKTKNYNANLINELIVNAFLHANYNMSMDFTILISPYKFTIINPGEFPKDYVPEDFMHARAHTIINNKIISKILHYNGLAHLNGNGYKTLQDFSKGNQSYIFKQNKNSFEFTVFLFQNKYKYLTTEKAIISIISEKPFIKADEIGLIIGKTRRTVQTVLKELKEKNLIVRKGSKKTGFWVVKN
ncbi:MAG: putative DNA binding domain-containing protein [Bacilli bacterium]|nr:putative DNA binding domain-containing protein [Bacilli bacterium]